MDGVIGTEAQLGVVLARHLEAAHAAGQVPVQRQQSQAQQRVNQAINSQLLQAYQTYQTNLQLVRLEESNQTIAKRNLDITLDKFKLGSISTVEFRDAQVNYLNATIRYSNAQYQAKIAEVALRAITGDLLLK